MIGAPLLLALASSSVAATPVVVVHGSGSVETPPDLAAIGFTLRGEASTSDEAVRIVAADRKAIVEAVSTLAAADFQDGKLSIEAVRGQDCKMDYDDVVLSSGDCAVRGFVASMAVTLRTTAVKDAATLVGLIGRLKGHDPSVGSFGIANPQSARRAAMAAAVKDAAASAEALALASGAKLGRILAMTDGVDGNEAADEVTVTARRAPPPPHMVMPPVPVQITPAPIQTGASVTVTYELMR